MTAEYRQRKKGSANFKPTQKRILHYMLQTNKLFLTPKQRRRMRKKARKNGS